MTQKSTPAAGGNIHATSEQRKFTKGMKWLKLGVDKDPEFGKQYFLYIKIDNLDCFYIGELDGINTHSGGKRYTFITTEGETVEGKITHYCIPKPPVD